MYRQEFIELVRRLYDAGFDVEAKTLVATWNRVNVDCFADIDPTPWEELLNEKEQGDGGASRA